jgi:hypothetical protein
MKIGVVKDSDIDGWLELAREVEPLFRPMAAEASFHEALKAATAEERAFCIRDDRDELCGVVVVSHENNGI